MIYHLAIDIGASSGRHILGWMENGKLQLEEIHRFENYIKDENGTLVWDIQHLTEEVFAGIRKCGRLGKIPETVGIDTWGVDYVLLDENRKEILPAVSYRDSRTASVQNEIDAKISSRELYARTGIQKQYFNTIYQLYSDKKTGKLDGAKYFLMMPDYLAFKLTGNLRNEYTNATTTSLVNAQDKQWDYELLETLEIPKELFRPLSLPCTEVGPLQGFDFESKVVLVPTHDTASAVAACPIGENSVYISSGTWSLIGTESAAPVVSPEAMQANFTNEGGIHYRYRFLKNIMGMWLLQNIRKNLNKQYTYDEMMRLAMECGDHKEINPNAQDFIAPDNMIEAIRSYLGDRDLPIATVLNSVYHSLANSYAVSVREIENISGKTIDTINIVGGGSKDAYLNRLTAQYTGKKVLAGPVEATAIGNLISQFMFSDPSLTLEKARTIVKSSFSITEVQ